MPLRKSFQADVTAASEGLIEAVVAVTGNVDLGNDIIVPGAFGKFLGRVARGERKLPPVLWQHDPSRPENVVGRITDMEELLPGDPRLPGPIRLQGFGGLLVKAEYALDTPGGALVFDHVRAGRITEFSFMYDVPEKSFDSQGHRLLKVIDPVIEVSNVLMGMNPLTATLSVKSGRGERLPDWMLAGVGIALEKARKDGRDERVLQAALQILKAPARRDSAPRGRR